MKIDINDLRAVDGIGKKTIKKIRDYFSEDDSYKLIKSEYKKEYKKDNIWIRQQDNLAFMKELESNSIDLIYCDILYGSGNDYDDYKDLKPIRREIENHYIPRIKEMHRILRNNGSIYLQMDTNINHWIRCIMDDVFGYDNFRNEIIWHYRTWLGGIKNYFPPKYDILLFYTKSDNWKFEFLYDNNYEDTINYQRWEDYIVEGNKIKGANYPSQDSRFMFYYDKWVEKHGREPSSDDIILEISYVIDSVWDIKAVDPKSKLRVNFSTQKPKKLIERIIKASSDKDDLVADFYMGSGTTAVVSLNLNRKFIGCDINKKAFDLTLNRIKNEVNECN